MNKHESKYSSTAFLMDEALIYLLNKKKIEGITVKEICQKAGVNRSTFYLHYESINDLVEETMQYINKKFMNCFVGGAEFVTSIKEKNKQELNLITEKYLIPYLQFVKENKNIFQASFKNPNDMEATSKYQSLKKYVLFPILDQYKVEEKEKEYLIEFYIHGLMAIIKKWIEKDCKDSMEEVEKIIIACVKGGQNEIREFKEKV